LWLVDHQMNLLVRERFGAYYVRIPLTTAPSIHNDNALTIDWESIVPKTKLSYILGNPPFLGYSIMNSRQKSEVENVFEKMKNFGYLDYVTCWYKKAAEYIQGTEIETAFVSTNSICQGEQVGYLWKLLLEKFKIRINFAHHTFKWSNEARGMAAVYCVIVGFANFERKQKRLFVYEDVRSKPKEVIVNRLNPYLVDADDILIESRTNPISNVHKMITGNRPLDDGNYLFTEDEKKDFIKTEPLSEKYFMPFISAKEYINNKKRFCLWLVDINPSELKKMPMVMKRVENCKIFRLKSSDVGAKKLADTPTLFREINNPKTFLLIPRVSSENRRYIPIGFFKKNNIPSDTCMFVPDAKIYDFGILTSEMHMAWTRAVCGRLKSDYRYSAYIVYNNFPWPNPTEKQKAAIEKTAQDVLDARAKFPKASLADLYDPVAMPPALAKAHQKLDKAVESAYSRSFDDDGQRVAFLFELYQKLSGELFVEGKKRGKG